MARIDSPEFETAKIKALTHRHLKNSIIESAFDLYVALKNVQRTKYGSACDYFEAITLADEVLQSIEAETIQR